MSSSGNAAGLVEFDTHLFVLESFGCHWTLAGCTDLRCRDARAPGGVAQPAWPASFFFLPKKRNKIKWSVT